MEDLRGSAGPKGNKYFDVIDQRSETRMSIVGGRQTAEVRLLVTLEPRRSGVLTVPALQFRGGSRTEPLSLTVDPALTGCTWRGPRRPPAPAGGGPRRWGTLTIPPMQLTGKLIERPSDRLWQPAVRGRRVRVESDPLLLDVSPRPASFSGTQWLPARQVDLAQQITDGDTVTVGEPVTRTVILEAVGLDEHMLEEPPWPTIDNARIYPGGGR